MKLSLILITWLIISIPAGILLGRLCAAGKKGCVAFSLVALSYGQACTLLRADLPLRSFLLKASSVV